MNLKNLNIFNKENVYNIEKQKSKRKNPRNNGKGKYLAIENCIVLS